MKSASFSPGLIARLIAVIAACCAAFLPEQSAVAGPSVVGLWRFNEGSGTTVTDSSGLGNNGVLGGGVLPVWVPGQTGFGSALLFTNDGTDYSYVSVPGASSLLIGQTATNAWSITAWAYESSGGTGTFVANYGRLYSLDDGATFYFDSGSANDDEMYTWSGLNTNWQFGWGTDPSPVLDAWAHWALVYDGTSLTLYLNANQTNGGMSSMPVTSALGGPFYTGSVIIGSQLSGLPSGNWNGMLDDVAVFSGA